MRHRYVTYIFRLRCDLWHDSGHWRLYWFCVRDEISLNLRSLPVTWIFLIISYDLLPCPQTCPETPGSPRGRRRVTSGTGTNDLTPRLCQENRYGSKSPMGTETKWLIFMQTKVFPMCASPKTFRFIFWKLRWFLTSKHCSWNVFVTFSITIFDCECFVNTRSMTTWSGQTKSFVRVLQFFA